MYGTLVVASAVAANPAIDEPASSLHKVYDWIYNDLTVTHSDLGRKSPVCPFVEPSIDNDLMWFNAPTDKTQLDFAEVEQIVRDHIPIFKQLPVNPPSWRALVLVFPQIDNEQDSEQLIDAVQRTVKPEFLEACLMIGEMHPWNKTPARANPTSTTYYPNRSPVPALAIRDMHPLDSELLALESDKDLRKSYLREYFMCIEWIRIPGRLQDEYLDLIAESAER